MKKEILFTLIALLHTISLIAQYSPCYESAFAEGKKLYHSGNYQKAKNAFTEAKNCPDPNSNAADEWISKCNKAIAEKEQKKKDDQALNKAKEKETAKTAYMKIKEVRFGNIMKNGDWIDECGSVLYNSEIFYLRPRIYYDGLVKDDKSITVDIKIIEPDGVSVKGQDSPSSYTYSYSFTVYSGKDNIETFNGYGNQFGTFYTPGTYGFELWYQGNMIYRTNFEVKPDGQRPKYAMLPDIELIKSNANNRYWIANGYFNNNEYDKALEWYNKAADWGSPSAQNMIGVMYDDAKGVKEDEIEATKWYRKAAEQGYDWGQYNLGLQYQYGEGTDKDYEEAYKWYSQAADQGLAAAQNRLGMFYDSGHGVDKDHVEAMKWYLRAAEQGYDWGQINLGHMYRYGKGVTTDVEKAKEWYHKAAAQGNERATELLKELEKDEKTPQMLRLSANGVGFNMCFIEGGNFKMGSSDSDSYYNEVPIHDVSLSSFYMGETEVTQALWKAVMGNNPSYFVGDNLPVEQVSWDDCQQFIKELNQITGRKFRLPTEAEWEYAARGGSNYSLYSFEDITIRGGNDSPNLDPLAWYAGNCGRDYTSNEGCDVYNCIDISEWEEKQYSDTRGGTHPVGKKQPNAYGLYDMLGNVMEWCSDYYGEYQNKSQTNPQGPSNGSERVLRGGTWSYKARGCRVSYRISYEQDTAQKHIGFRIVLSTEN